MCCVQPLWGPDWRVIGQRRKVACGVSGVSLLSGSSYFLPSPSYSHLPPSTTSIRQLDISIPHRYREATTPNGLLTVKVGEQGVAGRMPTSEAKSSFASVPWSIPPHTPAPGTASTATPRCSTLRSKQILETWGTRGRESVQDESGLSSIDPVHVVLLFFERKR